MIAADPIEQLQELVRGEWELVIYANDEAFGVEIVRPDGSRRELAYQPKMESALSIAIEMLRLQHSSKDSAK